MIHAGLCRSVSIKNALSYVNTIHVIVLRVKIMEHVLNLGLNINVNVPLDGKERTVRKLITVPK